MNEKTIIYILIIGAAVLGILGFFTGRASGNGGDFKADIKRLESKIDESIEGERIIAELNSQSGKITQSVIDGLHGMGDTIDEIEGRLENLQREYGSLRGVFDSGFTKLTEVAEEQRGLINQLAGSDRRDTESTDTIGNELESIVSDISGYLEEPPPGPD